MTQYIDKSALVAEIKRRKDICKNLVHDLQDQINHDYYLGKAEAYKEVLDILNTLEVKEVKEPSASDKGMAEEIIINLKRVEQDYHIDLTREMEWLRSKAQKGE